MKKLIALITCAVVAFSSLSFVANSNKLPLLGADVVAAATGDTSTGGTGSTGGGSGSTGGSTKVTTSITTGVAPSKLSRLIRFGSLGGEVRIVQSLLVDAGYKLTVDGAFGRLTLAAVKSYQRANGFRVDGIVGGQTYAKLSKNGTALALSRTLKYGYKGEDVKLVQTLLYQCGYKLTTDGILGKITQAALKNFQAKYGLKVDGSVNAVVYAKLRANAKTVVKVGKAEYAAHGTKCFTVATVAMAGDKIAAVYLDDYQFMPKASVTGVPNSDKDFGTLNFKDPANSVLASKRLNAEYYSNNMKTKGGATLTVDQNFSAVQAFAVGKTIAQLEQIASTNSTDAKNDAVTGATLADTNGYLKAIVAAAKAATANPGFEVASASISSLKLGKVEYAAHGTKCFTVAIALLAWDKIAAVYIDDYQFMPKASVTGVPNSDKDFGTLNFKDPANSVLASKRLNGEYYSNNMKTKGGATLTVDQNFSAVQAFAVGKTIAELEKITATNSTDAKNDAVAGATLADTNGYLNAIITAAKAAK